MGIFGAMSTANTGLRAQAFALEHISGNIANARTPGYKRTDTNFFDLISGVRARNQFAAGVNALSRPTNDIHGTIEKSGVETHLAISDNSFFVVAKRTGSSDGMPLFGGQNKYTRRGDFSIDRYGYLVNGAGYYLKGLPVDKKSGNLVGSMPQLLKIKNDVLPAKVTTSVTYRANIARIPLTRTYNPKIPNSELLDSAKFKVDPKTSGTGTVQASDEQQLLDQSIAGGSITTYAADGSPANIQFRWAKVAADTWNLFYQVDNSATGSTVAWKNAGVDYTFNNKGQMTSPANSITLSGLSINGVLVGDVILNHGDGLTQFAAPNGTVRITELNQNGYGAGEMSSISISETGRVLVNYTNGQLVDIAQITLANFNAQNALNKIDGGAFEETKESGNAILSSHAPLISKALESSNSDIADEFSKLIVTQQSYSANTRIITTGDKMLQESINMIR